MPKSKKDRPSSTAGRTKGGNCQKSIIKTQYCRDSKFFKTDPLNYLKACKIINNEKGNQKSGWIEDYERELKS